MPRIFVGNVPYGSPDEPARGRPSPAEEAPLAHAMSSLPRVDYGALYAASCPGGTLDVVELIDRLRAAWCDQYEEAVGTRDDLLEFEAYGFTYLFDFSAGTKARGGRPTEDRVVAAWGLSRRPARPRDASRMRGFPSPGRAGDSAPTHRGHLFGHALGGGTDVNLFPQDAALNTGRSPEGRMFRSMERYAAAHPGAFCFARPIYDDHSWRPASLEYGVRADEGLWVGRFANGPVVTTEP